MSDPALPPVAPEAPSLAGFRRRVVDHSYQGSASDFCLLIDALLQAATFVRANGMALSYHDCVELLRILELKG